MEAVLFGECGTFVGENTTEVYGWMFHKKVHGL
jgi:hypothetical protein